MREGSDWPAVTVKERARVSGPGLRTFLNIANRWLLSEEQRVELLGAGSLDRFRSWEAAARSQKRLALPMDVLMRISIVLGIFCALRQFLATLERERAWLFRARPDPPFLGRTAMEVLTSDTYSNRLAVRRSAEAAAFGCPPPPNEADRDFRPYTIKWM